MYQAELLNRMLDTVQAGIFCASAIRDASGSLIDFQIIQCNNQVSVLTGFPIEMLLSATLNTLDPEGGKSPTFLQYVKTVETGEPQRLEHYLPFSNTWLDVSISKFDDGVVASMNDVTQMKHAQQQLEAINRELSRSNENLRQFAYVASHDLQEPLRKIHSFGDLLRIHLEGVVSKDQLDLVTRMQKAADRMSVLVSDLLSYSRVGERPKTFQQVSLSVLLADICERLTPELEATGAVLTVEAMPTVSGDPDQLYQLFYNLVSNAVKFQKPNRKHTVHVTSCSVWGSDLPPTLQVVAEQRYHEICVADNGIGFDEKYSDRIFQVFQRLHSKNHFPGTGIGLAIVQKVVLNHQGAILTSSTIGKGSAFRVYLPDRFL